MKPFDYTSKNAPTDSLREHPSAGLVPDMRPEEWADFYLDIVSVGIRVPIEVTGDGTILDGRHRWRAAKEAGLTEVPVVDAPLRGDDPEIYMLKAAVMRRHLTDDQRAMIAAKWAQENKQSPPGVNGGRAPLTQAPTRHAAADMFGVSTNKVKEAVTTLNNMPELAEQVAAGDTTMREVRQERNKNKREERREEITQTLVTPTETDQKYAIIYADPPWKYEHIESESRSLDNQYPQMELDDIAALDIPAGDDAVLFMWATSPKLYESLFVMDAWGFDYRTCMVWVKDKIGMGYYARQRHEILLIGKKGEIPVPEGSNRPDSVIEAPRGKHSQKPAIFRELIEKMYPDMPRVELFARERPEGWDVWGNQVE